MNLRDLQYLVAIADLRHFGQAAEACFVSQPTLSTQIKKLETYLGVQLIERNHKNVFLTPIGTDIVAKARDILRDAQHIRELAAQAGDPQAGLLRIGIIPTLAPYLLPYAVPMIKHAYPKLTLFLQEEQTARLLNSLKTGDLDAVLLALPIEDKTLHCAPLFHEAFFVALPATHPLTQKSELSLPDLENQPLLLLAEGHCLRDQALAVCRLAHIHEKAHFTATSLETMRQMVAAGAGITLLPELAVATDIANQSAMTIRPFAEPIPKRSIALVWRPNTARQDVLHAISTLIKDKADTLPLKG